MADPKHPEHDHLKDWYGDAFDPNQPETDELKLEVLRLAKRWKPKNQENRPVRPDAYFLTAYSPAFPLKGRPRSG